VSSSAATGSSVSGGVNVGTGRTAPGASGSLSVVSGGSDSGSSGSVVVASGDSVSSNAGDVDIRGGWTGSASARGDSVTLSSGEDGVVSLSRGVRWSAVGGSVEVMTGSSTDSSVGWRVDEHSRRLFEFVFGLGWRGCFVRWRSLDGRCSGAAVALTYRKKKTQRVSSVL